MVVWLFGCMVVWLYGCMVVWLYGCMVVWLYGTGDQLTINPERNTTDTSRRINGDELPEEDVTYQIEHEAHDAV